MSARLLPMILPPDADIRIVAFADQLKIEYAIRTGHPTYEQLYITKTPEIRAGLQYYGTKIGRAAHPDIWIRALALRLEIEQRRHIGTRELIVVIPDVRFEDEARWIETQPNSLLIRLLAPCRTAEKLHLENTEHLAEHISETALDCYPFRYMLPNDPVDEPEVRRRLSEIITNNN